MADERRKRIPQPWLWALAGAALVGVFVFVFAVAPSLLIGRPPKGLSAADELKARNDVRTTLVQALAGLAVAGGLIVTYRTYRLNQAEQDRTYERELYAQAVEQLGHEKAPVRLGALYSLERLAQDKPERRQTIVNVICAYLRMPFSPTAPARKPESEATGDQGGRETKTETRTDEIGGTWQQEKQVRLTAQGILEDHLRDDRPKDKRSTEPPSPRFWPDVRLDLAGATLIDFRLVNGVMADANFGGATFTGDARFGGATFTGDARFGGATFTGDARFGGATFTGDARFGGATFTGDARFDGAAIFSGVAWFEGATFSGDASFYGATFSRDAWFGRAAKGGLDAWLIREIGGGLVTPAIFSGDANFGGATFTGDASFGWATFTVDARFGKASFSGDASFYGATFSRHAEFGEATFTGGAWFGGATFTGGAWFGKATFTGDAWFRGATFSGTAMFGGATFRGEHRQHFRPSRVTLPDAQHVWPTGWCLGPDGSGGYTVLRANDAGRS